MTKSPLEDTTILDCCQAGAGPFGIQLLAMAGAEVIQIEPPGGSSSRRMVKGTLWPNVSQGKRSVVVDLKSEQAPKILEPLVVESDIVVHNNPPDSAERLGLDYETLKNYKENIIVCSVTAFGDSGPYKNRLGFDSIAQAMSGIMSVTGESNRKPSRVGASMVDWGTGLYASIGIQLALRYREQNGLGQKVEVSLYDTASSFMNFHYTRWDMYEEISTREGHSFAMLAPYGLIETATDLIFLGVQYPSQWIKFCEEFDMQEWLEDPRFETLEQRLQNKESLYEEIENLFVNYDRTELINRLEGKIPVGEYRTPDEAAADEFLFDRGTLRYVDYDKADSKKTIAVGVPIRFSEGIPADDDLPSLGEHTETVLKEAGFTTEEINALEKEDAIQLS